MAVVVTGGLTMLMAIAHGHHTLANPHLDGHHIRDLHGWLEHIARNAVAMPQLAIGVGACNWGATRLRAFPRLGLAEESGCGATSPGAGAT